MSDDLSTIDGTWEGYYCHDLRWDSDANYPITATIRTDGRALGGTMIDGVTNFVHLYRKIVDASQGQLSQAAELHARSILAKFPDFKVETTLPEQSRLQGEIVGDRVRFTKTYLGTHTIQGSSASGLKFVRWFPDHRVRYEGILSPDRLAIDGRWTIPAPGLLGRFRKPQATGGFQLFRADPPAG